MEYDRNGMAVLDRAECLRRLGPGGVGRVAVTVGALPAIFPVNFAMLDDDVVFTTTGGTKLAAAARAAVVAFEVDAFDVASRRGWSVMVVGPSEQITDIVALARASRLPLARWTGGEQAEAFVRIRAEIVSGRDLVTTAVSA
jgi:nitroimidazol reductase NimA-like FMN-containing flavoprotein (pyridoxamine 5'-phosphate oxidase superfamily)